MDWQLRTRRLNYRDPSTLIHFIRGKRDSYFYSPFTIVASLAKRRYVDISDPEIQKMLNLDPRTYNAIDAASEGVPGYSRVVRRKLFKACRLPYHGPAS